MGIKHGFVSPKTDVSDATKVRPSDWNDDHEIDGDVDFGGHALTNIEDEAYNQTAWNGSLEAPTKNAIRDKIEALVLTGGGVTDFLALDDTPDTYTNASAGAGPFLQVNTAENAVTFKYSTAEYIDIRDYGTVVDGGDITAAWIAALTDYNVGHTNRCIRIPMVGSGTYTLDGAALTVIYRFGGTKVGAWIFELDCNNINLTSALALSSNHTWRGMRTYPLNTFIAGPMPGPGIALADGIDAPTFSTYDGTAPSACTNWRIDNLHFYGNLTNGIALQVRGGSLGYVTDCWCNTEGPDAPLVVDSIFWLDFERLFCEPRAACDLPAIRFTTETAPTGLACGLIRIKDLKTARNGILFENVTADAGTVGNIEIYDYISEGQVNGGSLIYFDSTAGQGVTNIKIIRPEIADPVSGTTYLIKNTAATAISTNNIYIEGSTLAGTPLYDPASNWPIRNLSLNMQYANAAQTGAPKQMALYNAGTPSYNAWRRDWQNHIDAKLLCAPIPGAQWNYGTPVAIQQNPASWVAETGTITTGKRGPDGSTMAAECTGRFRCGAHIPTTLAVGDYLVGGIWIRGTGGAAVECGVSAGPDPNGGWETNGENNPAQYYSWDFRGDEMIAADGWKWVCGAAKFTTAGSNPAQIQFFANIGESSSRYFFGPSLVHILASDAEDDAWMIRMSRMLRGGWSSKCPAGSVSILDHQQFWSGKGMAIVDGVTAPSTVAGFAQIYVDTADGDLKVKFGDGTIKTIVVDT